jgi:thymidylate synthase (FAD)
MKVTLIQATPKPIETIAQIASICYDSDPKDPMKLVRHLYNNGHHSVMEHIYFTFKIEGISRACSHQLVRHRHCSFTQRSQRYCSEDGYDFVNPIENIEDVRHTIFYDMVCDNADDYKELQKLGLKNEDARYILPNACATSLYLSCNLRELIHICNERLCSKAQWEIRAMVKEMVALVEPSLHFMLVPKCKSGRIICHTPCNSKEETNNEH